MQMSMISTLGGKRKLVKEIIPALPSANWYVEPFVGGGWIYLNKDDCKNYWINDANWIVYLMWLAIKDNDSKIESFYWKRDKEYFYKLKKRYKGVENRKGDNASDVFFKSDKLELLYIYRYLQYYGVFGDGETFVDTPNFVRKEEINLDVYYKNATKMVNDGVQVTNLDYKRVIDMLCMKQYKDVVVYLDPPYINIGDAGRYGNLIVSGIEFATYCEKLTKNKIFWLATVCEDMNLCLDTICSNIYTKKVPVKYASGNMVKGSGEGRKSPVRYEYLVSNYNVI